MLNITGVTSAAIGDKILSNVFKYSNFEVIVNKRKDGNGINDNLTSEILQYEDISLIITSDHGSSDKKNLTILRDKLKCKVIVTDHHLFKDELAPFNMDAFINPQRHDNELKDMTGAGVVYFTLVHAFLISDYTQDKKIINYIYYLLTYVGLTIISDCMDLKNYINRKIVIKALSDINSRRVKHEPFWEYIKTHVNTSYIIDESTLGFDIIPILNSPGRIADPRLSYELLVSKDVVDSKLFLDMALDINVKRKAKTATAINNNKNIEFSNGIIKTVLIDNADGVQGIIASNLMYDNNLKLVIIFTKTIEDGKTFYSGSGRSQDENLNIKQLLDDIAKKDDIIIKHGGHKKAIGVKIKPDIEKFYKLLKEETEKHNLEQIQKYYIDEYIYSVKKLTLNIFDIIDISPFGIGFEKPNFCSDLYIESYRIFRKTSNFISMTVKLSKESRTNFNLFHTIKEKDFIEFENNLKHNKFIRVVYNLNLNSYRNHTKIMLNATYVTFK